MAFISTLPLGGYVYSSFVVTQPCATNKVSFYTTQNRKSSPAFGLIMVTSPEVDEIVARIIRALPEYSVNDVKDALKQHKGNDTDALAYLTSRSKFAAKKQQALEGSKKGRISALEEARIRRKITGSAKDFFKSHVEVAGEYVDDGYVDESADAMASMKKSIGGFFRKLADKYEKK